jgi:hypothetical protein
MNIIKIENVRRIDTTTHSVSIKSDYIYSENNSIMVVLSEEDVENSNCLIKLKGYIISALLIPKKYKYTFNETSIGKAIIPFYNEKIYTISYY